jgi:hypothetical protein
VQIQWKSSGSLKGGASAPLFAYRRPLTQDRSRGCWSVKFPLSVFTPECMVSVMIVCLWCWCDLCQRVESNRSGVVHFLFD